jgi:hypothetical protein
MMEEEAFNDDAKAQLERAACLGLRIEVALSKGMGFAVRVSAIATPF